MSDIPVDIPVGDAGDDFDALGSEYDELLATDEEMVTLPKSKLQKYANEHKAYRQKWGSVKQAWEGAPDEDVQAMSAFYKSLASRDPGQIKAATEWVNTVIADLTPAEAAAVKEAIKEEAKETGQTQAEVKAALTPEDIEKMIEEKATKLLDTREAKRAEETAIQQNLRLMEDHGKTLAEEHGIAAWADKGSRLYGMLMQATSQIVAQEGVKDLAQAMNKAAAVILEDLQSVNVAVLSKKKQTAGAAAKASPKTGVEPVGQGKPTSFEDANKRAMARLMANVGK